MLQELLNLGLVDIGSDDARLDKMEAAGAALADALRATPAMLIPATLVALDNTVDEDDPMLDLAEDHVKHEWRTLRNTHANRPRELLRAIIIHALAKVTEGNPRLSGIVFHTGITLHNLRLTRLGKEASLVSSMLASMGDLVERSALQDKSNFNEATTSQYKRKLTKAINLQHQAPPQVQDSALLQDVQRASNPNGNLWPNQGQPWSNAFAPLMTSALVKGINLGLSTFMDSMYKVLDEYDAVTEKKFVELDKIISEFGQGAVRQWESTRMRIDILWWLEAKYSPSLKRGYADLQSVVAAAAMAFDLAELVPAFCPASVIYILRKAVASLSTDSEQDDPMRIGVILAQLAGEGSLLHKSVSDMESRPGRVSLLEVVEEAIAGKQLSSKDMRNRLGVDSRVAMSLVDFAGWLFRDLLARKLLEGSM